MPKGVGDEVVVGKLCFGLAAAGHFLQELSHPQSPFFLMRRCRFSTELLVRVACCTLLCKRELLPFTKLLLTISMSSSLKELCVVLECLQAKIADTSPAPLRRPWLKFAPNQWPSAKIVSLLTVCKKCWVQRGSFCITYDELYRTGAGVKAEVKVQMGILMPSSPIFLGLSPVCLRGE